MKKIVILMIAALCFMVLTAGVSLADNRDLTILQKVSGQVVQIDAAAGKIVIMTDGEKQFLMSEPKLLEGIKVGEQVNIEKIGEVLKSIQRAEVKPIE